MCSFVGELHIFLIQKCNLLETVFFLFVKLNLIKSAFGIYFVVWGVQGGDFWEQCSQVTSKQHSRTLQCSAENISAVLLLNHETK